ncbi:MAG: hypothetical protein QGG73_12490 [Candidatus Hydrogenedentes bacterium]|jgi:hypothetical protein|nr:hypothetical protein [Candidatus Hydrogenedentota bacterium]
MAQNPATSATIRTRGPPRLVSDNQSLAEEGHRGDDGSEAQGAEKSVRAEFVIDRFVAHFQIVADLADIRRVGVKGEQGEQDLAHHNGGAGHGADHE